MASRLKSPSVVYTQLSPNCTKPRTGPIRRLSPHCVAGNLSIEATLNLSRFVTYDPSAGASCNYSIGSDGRLGLGVEETNRSWCTSSRANDMEAITFEIANDGGAPDWRMSDAAVNAWLNVAVEIAQFYGFKKVAYREKSPNITIAQVEQWIATWAPPDAMIITLHNWYAAKSCPGPYFIRQLPWLVKEINTRLSGGAPTLFVGEGAVNSGSVATTSPPSTAVFSPYLITIDTPSLNVRKAPGTNTTIVKRLDNDKNTYTIVEEAAGPGATKWCKLKSGIGWVSADYIKKK